MNQPAATPAFVLRAFGAFSVTDADGTDRTPRSRKARALLACCALSAPAAVRRDRLAALLWSGRGWDQARASLRQSLYELRAFSGVDPPLLIGDRTAVRVDHAAMMLDVTGIHHDSDGSEELLADLDGITPAFDAWLAAERPLRREQRRAALLTMAEKAAIEGAFAIARQMARRQVACDPLDERAVRLAIAAACALGDPDDARRIFARFRDALRHGLGLSPSPAMTLLYERIGAAASREPSYADDAMRR
jgi:DNA-binding SARP family transcriptional activator